MTDRLQITETWTARWRAIWRRPRTFTAMVPVGSQSVEDVNARLARLAPEICRALAQVSGVHTVRLLAVPPASGDAPTRVLLNFVYDRPLEEHLPVFLGAVGALFVAAFEGEGVSDVDQLPALLERYRVREHTYHLGSINRTVEDILADQRLLETVEAYADDKMASGVWNVDTSPELIRRQIRAFVLSQPAEAKLPTEPAAPLSFFARVVRLVSLAITFAFPAIGVLAPHIAKAIRRIESRGWRDMAWIAYGLWWIYGALFTGAAMVFVRILEKVEPDVEAPPPDPEKVKRLEDVEDLHLKNSVTFWLPIRETFVRRVLLRVILWGSERGCRHFWTHGALADIDTIHYARIMPVDGGRTMLFMSDYDGSLDRYLMDFLGVGSSAVIPISSNVATCPKTRWLFNPEDVPEFTRRMRSLLRTYQLEIPVWYSAYPNLSVRDVLSNGALRDGLFVEHMTDEAAAQWLARL